MESQNIVSHSVYNVIKIKDKFGFRVCLNFDDNTKQVRQFSGFLSKKDANQEREKIIAQLVTGTFIVPKKQLVGDYLIDWLETDIKLRATANTYASYKNAITRHIVPEIGKIYLTDLKRTKIKSMYTVIAEKSVRIASLSKTIMNTSLRCAVNKGKISENPATDVPLPKNVKTTAYHTRTINEKNTLNLEQIVTLIEASRGTGIYMQVIFATLMGLRRGEINGLKYSDIDYVHQKISVLRQLGRAPNSEDVEFAPKTKTKQEIKLKTESSYRILDIPDFVFEEILNERKLYEKHRNRRKREFQDLDYICCSTYGRPRSMQFHYVPFKKLLKENDLPNIRWHDLRHSYATLLMKNDFNLKAISKLLGHSKEIVTADNYIENCEIIADGVEELEEYLEDVLPQGMENYNETEQVYDCTNLFLVSAFEELTT